VERGEEPGVTTPGSRSSKDARESREVEWVTRTGRMQAGGSPPREPETETSLQERLEDHQLGRALITGAILFALAAMLVSNLPSSALKREALPVVRPLLDASALTQNWNLFAPDPRNSTLRLAARMTYRDGVTLEWHQPESDPVIGPYRLYRWRKLANNLLSERRAPLWPAITDWLARNHLRDGEPPLRVVLIRQFYNAPSPGSGDLDRPPWREDVLFRAETGGGPR
jgi:hypothetical protein